jgi:transcriptional regulator with XRE-family HTH domain
MSKDICKIFGRRMQKLRLEKGFSQEELGFELGLDKSTIGKYELARRCVNIRQAKKIADILGVKLSELLD